MILRSTLVVLAIFGVQSGLQGCSNTNTTDSSSRNSADTTFPVRETSGGTYFVRIAPQPSPIPLNTVFALGVSVYLDAAMTKPATGVVVTADARMPEHHHGMTLVPKTVSGLPGQWRVEGMLMHMPGYWEIYVDVRAEKSDKPERARFEVTL